MKKVIHTENAPKPSGPYSQGIKVDKFLFISGQIAIDPTQGKIVATNIKEQTNIVLANIKAILQAADYNLTHVIQSNVYLSSMALFNEFNKEYAKHFNKEFPTRATVGIELTQGALVEISMIAYKE